MNLQEFLHPWMTPSNAVILAAALVALGVLWALRIRDLARQRAANNALQALSEEIFTARSAVELHASLSRSLQELLEVTSVTIYSHSRTGNSLHAVAPAGTDPAVIPLEGSKYLPGLRLAFQQTRPVLMEEPEQVPCPVLWLPMSAEGETTGVLEFRFASFGRRPDENARLSLQHLANQVGIALLLLEQRQLRDEILRGERLGAALELVAGIAAEVQGPVERIRGHAARLLQQNLPPDGDSLARQLSNDAAYASGVIERLVAFGRGAPAEPGPFDLNVLVQSLVEFRRDPWRMLILEPEIQLCAQQLPVFGVQGQLEQALLALLVHAEQSIRSAGTKHIAILTAAQGSQGVLGIELAAEVDELEPNHAHPEFSSMGLAVVRGIVEGHGGVLTVNSAGGRTRFEVRLPLAGPPVAPRVPAAGRPSTRRRLTLMVCMPSETERRRLIEVVAQAGHRAVPAGSAAEALELLERLKFDVVMASSGLTDMHWTELMDRVRAAASGFLLVDTAQVSTGSEMPVVRPPYEPAQLEESLSRVAG